MEIKEMMNIAADLYESALKIYLDKCDGDEDLFLPVWRLCEYIETKSRWFDIGEESAPYRFVKSVYELYENLASYKSDMQWVAEHGKIPIADDGSIATNGGNMDWSDICDITEYVSVYEVYTFFLKNNGGKQIMEIEKLIGYGSN